MRHIWIIADTYNHKLSPNQQSGATTRLTARTAEFMGRSAALNEHYSVQYFDIQQDFDQLMSMDVPADTAAVLIANVTERKWPVMQRLNTEGALTYFHLADPHVKNTDPQMAVRQSLHERMLRNVTGIVGSSPANAKVGLDYNANSLYIPDVMDTDVIQAPKTAWAARSGLGINFVSAGYPLHHPGFFAAAETLAVLSAERSQIMHYEVVTSDVSANGKITHAAESGKDYYEALDRFAATNLEIGMRLSAPFTADKLHKAMTAADISIIPSDPQEELSQFQRVWFPKKAEVRVVTALAYGLLPIAVRPFYESYQRFAEAGAIVTGTSTKTAVETALSLSAAEVESVITSGQAIVKDEFAPLPVAKKWHQQISRDLALRAG